MKNINFKEGKLKHSIIIFTLPMIINELLQNLYHSVDQLVVGNMVGDSSLAAINSVIPIMELLIGFFNGLGIGASVILAHASSKQSSKIKSEIASISFSFAIFIGIIISLAGIVCAPAILLHVVSVDNILLHDSLIYLDICFLGLVFTIIYNIGAGLLRALGDVFTPFLILSVSCLLNLCLDYFTVGILHMGIWGASVATMISQLLSAVLIFLTFKKKFGRIKIGIHILRLRKDILLEFLRIGFPSGLQNSLISLSNLLIWRSINIFPHYAAAGIGSALRVQQFLSLPSKGFGLTITTLVSQNYAVGNHSRCKKGVSGCLLLALSVIFFMSTIVFTFSKQFISLFNKNTDVIRYGVEMLHVTVPLYFILTIRDVFAGALRGYGNVKVPMWLSLFGMAFVRQLYLTIQMHINPSVSHIYHCYPVAWFITSVLMLLYYYYFTRTHMNTHSSY